jgi:hypothetical protein
MPPAEPAVVDPNGRVHAAAKLGGKLVNRNLARRSHAVAANEFDDHGKREEAKAGDGKAGLPSIFRQRSSS